MTRLLASALAGALAFSPLAVRADDGDPCRPPKPAAIDGVKVKRGSCGPYMMKADDISVATTGCTGVNGKPLVAHYKSCKLQNAKKAGAADAKKGKPAPAKKGGKAKAAKKESEG